MTPHSVTQAHSEAPPKEDNPLLSGEELYKMSNIGRSELVKGELIRMAPAGHPHGYIEFNIGGILYAFVRQHKLGRVIGGEVGIYTGRDPDTVRGADVAFISNERLAQVKSSSFLDVAPELVAEVLSPDDSWSGVMEKLEECFNIGVKRIWVADPRRRVIDVYSSLTEMTHLTLEDTLTGGDILPNFSVPVSEIFACLDLAD